MRTLPIDYAVRNLGRSRARLLLSVLGSTLVVTLVLAAAAFVHGMESALRQSGGRNNVMVLGAGSEESVERSEIESGVPGILSASLSGIRERGGMAYLSPEVHVQVMLTTSVDGRKQPLTLMRGVTPAALLVHDELQILDGRFPMAGADEVMVGHMAHLRMGVPAENLAVGNSVYLESRPWRIVGTFVAPGTVLDAEVWAPREDLKQALKRATDSCIVLTLDPQRGDYGDVAAFTMTRVDLELVATRETDYYSRLNDFFAPVRLVVWVTAVLIALGGLLGGLNTMFAAFAARVREIGTLQSLGYRRAAIVWSLTQEACLATAIGALLACGLCVWLLDGASVRFSMGVFGLRVDAPVIAIGMGSGLLLGLCGALPPAWRCLRLTIPAALKSN